MVLPRLVDAALEGPIAPSFTRIGYAVRRRVADWSPAPGPGDLDGRVMVVTGATSGLGRAAAEQLAAAGATLVVVGRSSERTETCAEELRSASGNTAVTAVAADMGDRDQVRALAEAVLADHDRLDVLIHNAGALSAERRENADGIEATVASQVVGPFLLTSLLLDRLAASAPSRVLTMSSGGMYAAPLAVNSLALPADRYKGADQYARAKRAQVTLNELWAERFGSRGIGFHALHPGWAATPGVAEALPTFGKVLGPVLRSAEEGADTLVWLASAPDGEIEGNGRFWHDRRPRTLHRLPSTRRSDTPERRAELWDQVVAWAGVNPGRGGLGRVD